MYCVVCKLKNHPCFTTEMAKIVIYTEIKTKKL